MSDTWISQAGGDWSDPDNWQGGVVPGAGDSVTITSTVAETITISTAVSVQSLVIDDPAAAIDLLNSGTIVAAGDVNISAADMDLDGSIHAGGTVSIAVSGLFTDRGWISAPAVILDPGALTIISIDTVTVGNLGSVAATLNLGTPVSLTTNEATGILIANYVNTETVELDVAAATAPAIMPWTLESSGDILATGFVTDDGVVTVSCFAAGTRIATSVGTVAVERLAVGDAVTLAGGGTAPIVWIGQRRVDCRRHPAPERVWPVRIEADAFGMGRPHAPLFLSPDHAVFVDDMLVPVKRLVNGTTIRQMPVAGVTYFHLELARHDVVLANGLPVETYLDTGGRAVFGERVITLHPEFGAPADLALAWEQKGFAPLVSDAAMLDHIRARLAVQAALLQTETTQERLTKTS